MTPPPGGVVLSAGAIGAGLLAVLLAAGCASRGPAAPPGDGSMAIGAVQGVGAQSPWLGRQVQVEGVVTANFAGALGGFFVQSARADRDPRTSEGLFVVSAGALPAPGARVRVAGTVRELGNAGAGQTAIEAATVEVRGRAPTPAPTVLHAPAPDWEALEGMRVRIAAPLTVSGNDQLLRFGELVAAFDGRLVQPTERHAPGPAADALAAANARRTLLLDDARLDESPAALWTLPQPLSPAAPLRAGSRIEGAEGVLEQRFGRYRLQPLAPFEALEQAPRPAPTPRTDGLRIAAFNVLNLFNGDGRGGGFPTPRGARSPAEYAQQLAKLLAALRALDADILALVELENDGDAPASSVAQLTAAMNAAAGARVWEFVPSPAPGGDAIRVGLLFRSDRVATVGPAAQLDRGPFAYGSRPPLAQAFDVGAGAPLRLVVNHFKSKGGCDAARGADADRGDHQACWNAARMAAADALLDWLGTDPTGAGGARTLLLGDFNAYAQEDPIQRLRAGGYRDLFDDEDAVHYSYVFRGLAGRLDHALATPAAAALVAGATIWHANADESEAFGYRHGGADRPQAGPYRASDHDPLVLDLAAPGLAPRP